MSKAFVNLFRPTPKTPVLHNRWFARPEFLVQVKRVFALFVESLVIWIGALFYLYGFLQTAYQFYWLGAIIALVLGGSQALSRSLYAQMIPPGHEAEYFSFYEITDKGASWLGPLHTHIMLLIFLPSSTGPFPKFQEISSTHV